MEIDTRPEDRPKIEHVVYEVPEGAKLLILGARDKKTDKEIFWFSPRVISDRGIAYVKKLPSAPAKTQAVDRLAFFLEHLNDAADSVKRLADFLERNPNALLTGKKKPQ